MAIPRNSFAPLRKLKLFDDLVFVVEGQEERLFIKSWEVLMTSLEFFEIFTNVYLCGAIG